MTANKHGFEPKQEFTMGGIAWTGTRRRDYYVSPEEMKNRWEYVL